MSKTDTHPLYPLPDTWDAYAHTLAADSTSYGSSFTHLACVTTCQEWGGLMHHLPSVGCFATHEAAPFFTKSMRRIAGFSFFRHSVTPEWENPHNHGGITLSARMSMSKAKAQATWLSLCCECAGGLISDDVLGIQVLQKRGKHNPVIRFEAWLRKGCDVQAIARYLREMSSLTFEVAKRDQGC